MRPSAILISLFCWLVGSSVSNGADHPNVLFIAADDLRNDLACYGHPIVQTPNLDRLAARGVIFDRAYCQQAVCNPSRASLMTGRHPDTLQIWDLPTHFRDKNPDIVTLPEHFKQQGYFTQNIGKIFHNWIHEVQGDPQSWSVPAVMHFANHGRDKAEVEGEVPSSSAVDPNDPITATYRLVFDAGASAADLVASTPLTESLQGTSTARLMYARATDPPLGCTAALVMVPWSSPTTSPAVISPDERTSRSWVGVLLPRESTRATSS